VEKTTKVFDTFIDVGAQSPVVIVWPKLELTRSQTATLGLLLSRMAYFGRAESWVEARLTSSNDQAVPSILPNVLPLEPKIEPKPDQELTRVLCAMRSQQIVAWRTRAFEEALEQRLADKRRDAEAKGKDSSKV